MRPADGRQMATAVSESATASLRPKTPAIARDSNIAVCGVFANGTRLVGSRSDPASALHAISAQRTNDGNRGHHG